MENRDLPTREQIAMATSISAFKISYFIIYAFNQVQISQCLIDNDFKGFSATSKPPRVAKEGKIAADAKTAIFYFELRASKIYTTLNSELFRVQHWHPNWSYRSFCKNFTMVDRLIFDKIFIFLFN